MRQDWHRAASLLALSVAAALAASAAQAQQAAPAGVSELIVTAQRLDQARQTVEPALGASTYSLSKQLVDVLPGGENTQLNQVLLQAPGVTQDSFGQLHVRDDHGNIQYRLNNVILPEGLAVFGQALSPRIASNVELITGALPPQYGLRTAGVVNITTKTGIQNGGQASLYGGSHGLIEPSAEYGGSWGADSLFVSGSFTRTDVGIESPDGSATPLHDRSNQLQAFGYFDHIIDDQSRLSLIAGTSQSTFQIPDLRGAHPSFAADNGIIGLGPGGALQVDGVSDDPSDNLNERQREGTSYAIASYLRTADKLTLQASVFARYSTLTYRPDVLGELLFNGISQYAAKRDAAAGLQVESVYRISDAHTLRAGVIVEGDRSTSRTTSQVIPLGTNAQGQNVQTSDVPLTILDDSAKTAWTYSGYVQDEWKLLPALTLNYGLRFDQLDAYRHEHQWSPRVNLVWTPLRGTTFHAGYARYFTPPPFGLVSSQTVAKFAGTTAAAAVGEDTTPYAERTHYFDLGAQKKLGRLTLGLDAYYRRDHDLLDEGQFGAPIILTPFNYRTGYAKGLELSLSYARGPVSLYANGSVQEAQGRDIISSQFNFSPDELAYIAAHDIYLDHDQTYTASAGASYRIGATHLNGDLLFGSGLRANSSDPVTLQSIPNGAHLPSYLQVNFSASHDFANTPAGPISVRADLINAFDRRYQIRNGTGVGVGAPQWGPRRGVFIGLTKSF